MTQISQKFDRFIIQSLLGVGGSGRVYRAFDPKENRVVALKVFISNDSDEESMSRLRFRREFRAASRLNHPHLVQVYETGHSTENEFYVMEFIEGHDFEEHLLLFGQSLKNDTDINDPQRVAHILDLFIQISEALLYLHSNKFVHRDIKPGNVLVSLDSCVKLADFGLMREVGASQMTRTGSILGTVEYMSPEQTVTAKVDARSDIYSVGVMMFKAFTGQLPFSGGLMRQLISRTKEESPDPRSINSKIDKRIAFIISKTLKRHPEERYQSSQMLLQDLLQVKDQLFGDSSVQTTTTLTIEAPVGIILKPALIGRDNEINQMRRAIDQIKNKQPGALFFIRGEAGVGKSRLCAEVETLAAFHGLAFCKSVGRDSGGGDFQIWTDLLPQCFEIQQKHSVPWPANIEKLKDTLGNLMEVFRNPLGPQDPQLTSKDAQRYQFFDAVCRYLLLLSEKIPLVIHFDNYEKVENSSVELLQFIARRSVIPPENWSGSDSRGCLLLLVSYREEDVPDGHQLQRIDRILNRSENVHMMKLRCLDRDQVEEMIRSMLGGEHASPNFAERVFSETNGNPLFVESTIKTLVEEGILRKRGGIWVGASAQTENFSTSESISFILPASLKESARRRLVNLPPVEQEIVRAASVIGDTFTFEELLLISGIGEDEVLDAVDRLLRSEILEEKSQDEELYRFISNHLRDVAYESIDLEERRVFHQKMAGIVERRNPQTLNTLNQLAYHLAESGDQNRAFPVCERVADAYYQTGNSERAIVYIDRALQFISPGQKQSFFKLKLNRAHCLFYLGQIAEAQRLYRDLIRITSRLSKSRAVTEDQIQILMQSQFKSLLGLTDIELQEGNLSKAQRINTWLLEHCKNGRSIEDSLEPILHKGTILMHQGKLDEALVHYESALKESEIHGLKKQAASCHHNIGNIHFYRTEYNLAEACYINAHKIRIMIGDEKGAASVKSNIGNVYKMHEEYEKALSLYQEAAKSAETVGDISNWPLYIHNIASILLRLGKFEQSIINFRKALAIFEEQGSSSQCAMCMNNMALALWEGGRVEEAQRIMMKAYEIYKNLGYQVAMNTCLLNLGSLNISLNRLDQAQICLDHARKNYAQMGPTPGITECEIQLGRLSVKHGRLSEALDIMNGIDISVNLGKSTLALYYMLKGEYGIAAYMSGNHQIDPEPDLKQSLQLFIDCRGFAYILMVKEIYGRFLIDSGIDPTRGESLLEEIQYRE